MAIINVKVEKKIAKANKGAFIVCGNSDYTLHFSFDEEWQGENLKTARFVYNGTYTDIVFEGDTCPVPVLKDTSLVAVGVFAGDLKTTTPALIACRKCITDENGMPADPAEDVYNQIIELCGVAVDTARSVEERANAGEFKGDKGDKGDAGSIKFIPVVELPTDNIDESAIYLLPLESDDAQNRFTEYVYIDGSWEVIGAITVQVDHSEYVKFTDYATTNKAGVFTVNAYGFHGLTMIDNGTRLAISGATNSDIESGTNTFKPIVASSYRYAVKKGITTNTEELTDEEKAAACDWLGAMPNERPANSNNGDGFLITFGTDGKTIGYKRLYGSYVDAPYSVPYRDGNGVIHGKIPTAETGLTPKKYVDDGFVAKQANTGSMNVVYGEEHSGKGSKMFTLASGGTGDMTIPMRNANGQFDVRTPQSDLNVTNKAYVDGLIAELLARIEALEGK